MPFRRLNLVFVLGLISSCCRAQTCNHVDQVLTKQRRSTYASLIAATAKNRGTLLPVQILQFMRAGGWTLVFAIPKGRERGILFFQNDERSHDLPRCMGRSTGTRS